MEIEGIGIGQVLRTCASRKFMDGQIQELALNSGSGLPPRCGCMDRATRVGRKEKDMRRISRQEAQKLFPEQLRKCKIG